MKKTTQQFSKFSAKKSNAAIKEQFRQEKRKIKKEREEYFDKKKAEARAAHHETRNPKPPTPNTQPHPDNYRDRNPQLSSSMPLNKFIAHAGVAARREAAELVKKGLVKVNGVLVTEPGHKVSSKDEVKVNGKKVWLAKNLVYILLNKPKDYITTTDDPQGRKTVLGCFFHAGELLFYNRGEV